MADKPKKSDRAFFTNTDSEATEADSRRADAADKYADYVNERVRRAERDEKEGGEYSPDIIFGFQERGKYTYDKKFDASRDKIASRTSLPVQEYVVEADGELVAYLSEAAYAAIEERQFCGKCFERQPEDHHERRRLVRRLAESSGVSLPNGGRDNCPYCGAVLGISGEYKPSGRLTDEQKSILEVRKGILGPDGNPIV